MLSFIYQLRDLIFRLQLKLFSTHRYEVDGSLESDSQKSNYVQSVLSILGSQRNFGQFRRKNSYREILEHLNFRQGSKYLHSIQELQNKLGLDLNWEELRRNDEVGNPIKYKFSEAGKISPTTLRYVNVGLQIQELFGASLNSLVEVGAGYGGQARILDELLKISKYTIFDLPEVNELIAKYLSHYKLDLNLEFDDVLKVTGKKWDLAISNYAFSELPKELQIKYVKDIFLNSRRGFVIMNSGRSNLTGRSGGKLRAKELLAMIPGSTILEEKPLTGPDNYLLTWGFEEIHK